jgi:monofunctional biosynthetic peptidoglycan transglycosylase
MKIVLRIFLAQITFTALIAMYLCYEYFNLPDVRDLKGCYTAKMNNVDVCSKNGNYVRLSSISQNLIDAIVASEDAAFWIHKGVDWHELEESFRSNWASGKFKRGGSTITQQLIKNVFYSSEKSISRKVKEAILAHRLEQVLSKKEILEKYLNTIEFGPNIYGIKSASLHYFGKSAADLNILESSFLAFLLPNPKGYYQSFRQGRLTPFARKMVLLICKRLFFYQKIAADEYNFVRNHVDQFPWSGLSFGQEFYIDGESLEDLTEEALDEEFNNLLENVSPSEQESSVEDSTL